MINLRYVALPSTLVAPPQVQILSSRKSPLDGAKAQFGGLFCVSVWILR